MMHLERGWHQALRANKGLAVAFGRGEWVPVPRPTLSGFARTCSLPIFNHTSQMTIFPTFLFYNLHNSFPHWLSQLQK
jgi:hypothetical protein